MSPYFDPAIRALSLTPIFEISQFLQMTQNELFLSENGHEFSSDSTI